MPRRPLVSILIPAYNPRFFEPCLVSSIAQTYDNIEIIVADDSEGNDIRDVVARRRAEHVRYVHNPTRLGFHGNFAQLFSRAKGRYIKRPVGPESDPVGIGVDSNRGRFRCNLTGVATSRVACTGSLLALQHSITLEDLRSVTPSARSCSAASY